MAINPALAPTSTANIQPDISNRIMGVVVVPCHGGNGTDPTRNASYQMTMVLVAMVATTIHQSFPVFIHLSHTFFSM